jgi:hypothetical protein
MKTSRETDTFERFGFVLDLDENILSTELKPGDNANPLSKSAESMLSRSSAGIIDRPEIMPGVHAFRVIALRRLDWLAFFQRAAEINERYQKISGDKRPLIYCMFLTSALYTGDEFKKMYLSNYMAKL